MILEGEAKQGVCPMSITAPVAARSPCMGARCMAWRWAGGPIATITTAAYLDKGSATMCAEPPKGEGWSMMNPGERLTREGQQVRWGRLRGARDPGWCGLGGKPE